MATTIKVSVELRDRINEQARARGTTASGLIEAMLEDLLRRSRMESFGQAMDCADEAYWDEVAEWDGISSDGRHD